MKRDEITFFWIILIFVMLSVLFAMDKVGDYLDTMPNNCINQEC